MPPRRLTRDYLSCILFCFHSVFLPTLCARDSCIDAPPAERRKRRYRELHGDRSGLYRPPRKTPLYREKASVSNLFSDFHIFRFFYPVEQLSTGIWSMKILLESNEFDTNRITKKWKPFSQDTFVKIRAKVVNHAKDALWRTWVVRAKSNKRAKMLISPWRSER